MSVSTLLDRVADEQSADVNEAWTDYKRLIATTDPEPADVARLRTCIELLRLPIDTVREHAVAVQRFAECGAVAATIPQRTEAVRVANENVAAVREHRQREIDRLDQEFRDARGAAQNAFQVREAALNADGECARLSHAYPYLFTDAPTPFTPFGRVQISNEIARLDVTLASRGSLDDSSHEQLRRASLEAILTHASD